MSMLPIVGLDMEGREVRVGDHVYCAVSRNRGTLTKALVEQIEENLRAWEEPAYRYVFHVKTIPGNRRTRDWFVVKVQP